MREERESEDQGYEGEVVDAEIGEVFSDPRVGFGEGFGSGHGGPVYEFGPWAALREALADRGG